MPTFRYVAVGRDGKQIAGTLDAQDERAVATVVRENGYMVTSIARATQRTASTTAVAPPGVTRSGPLDALFFRVKLRNLVFLMNQLHHAINAGMSVGESLTVAGERMRHGRLRFVVQQMARNTQQGAKLSDEMRRFPTVFTESMIGMVAAGETSGDLAGMLKRVADFLDYENRMRMRLALQSFYPIALILFALFVPTAVTLFLRGPEVWLHQVARLFVWVAAPTLLFIVAKRLLSSVPGFAAGYDQFKLAIPGIGNMIRKMCVSRFCHTLAALYSAGLGMLQAVETAACGCGNHHLMRRLMSMLPSLREGAHIADVLEETRQFPNEVIHMAHVGERTGDLDSLLHKVAEYMEEEADAAANKALLIVLPVLLVIVGVVFFLECLPLIHQYLSPYEELMK